MTKIYEALEQAYQDRNYADQPVVDQPVIALPKGDSLVEVLDLHMEDKMCAVYQNIVTGLPDRKSRIVQFVEPGSSRGASALVRELAKVSALKLNKSVLLLDANPSRTRHSEFFNIRSKWHWNEAVQGGEVLRSGLRPIGKSSLYVVQILMDSESVASIDMDERHNALFEDLKQMFDLILIDYPSASSHPEGFMLTPKVDGVVMVLEAGRTRWQVAEQLKERIYSQGGHILGVVLNKRSYPIPQYVYDKL